MKIIIIFLFCLTTLKFESRVINPRNLTDQTGNFIDIDNLLETNFNNFEMEKKMEEPRKLKKTILPLKDEKTDPEELDLAESLLNEVKNSIKIPVQVNNLEIKKENDIKPEKKVKKLSFNQRLEELKNQMINQKNNLNLLNKNLDSLKMNKNSIISQNEIIKKREWEKKMKLSNFVKTERNLLVYKNNYKNLNKLKKNEFRNLIQKEKNLVRTYKIVKNNQRSLEQEKNAFIIQIEQAKNNIEEFKQKTLELEIKLKSIKDSKEQTLKEKNEFQEKKNILEKELEDFKDKEVSHKKLSLDLGNKEKKLSGELSIKENERKKLLMKHAALTKEMENLKNMKEEMRNLKKNYEEKISLIEEKNLEAKTHEEEITKQIQDLDIKQKDLENRENICICEFDKIKFSLDQDLIKNSKEEDLHLCVNNTINGVILGGQEKRNLNDKKDVEKKNRIPLVLRDPYFKQSGFFKNS